MKTICVREEKWEQQGDEYDMTVVRRKNGTERYIILNLSGQQEEVLSLQIKFYCKLQKKQIRK